MSPKVLSEKLILLSEVLADLAPHVKRSHDDLVEHHYEIERQVQVCVDVSCAIARRILFLKELSLPQSARDAFLELGKAKIITKKLAEELALACGLRNLLIHEYGHINYDLFFSGLPKGYKSLHQFAKIAEKFLEAL